MVAKTPLCQQTIGNEMKVRLTKLLQPWMQITHALLYFDEQAVHWQTGFKLVQAGSF